MAFGEYFSKTYGISRQSILNQSRFFHVIGGLPTDAMHDILEGLLQYETKEMLKQFIKVDSFFSLEELNRRIGKFDFGYYNDKNKPAPITEQKLSSNDNSLKQHGKFCWYCVFPFALSSVSDTILIEFLLIYMYYAGRLFCLHYFKLGVTIARKVLP